MNKDKNPLIDEKQRLQYKTKTDSESSIKIEELSVLKNQCSVIPAEEPESSPPSVMALPPAPPSVRGVGGRRCRIPASSAGQASPA